MDSRIPPSTEQQRISELEAALSAKDALVRELGEQLEFDRTAVAASMTAANKAVDQRHWLTEGRGPYEWNDDRWHSEFYAAALEIKAALEPLTKIAANWAGCPMKAEDVARARIDWKQRAEAAERQVADERSIKEAEKKILLQEVETNAALRAQLQEARDSMFAIKCWMDYRISSGPVETKGHVENCGHPKLYTAVLIPDWELKQRRDDLTEAMEAAARSEGGSTKGTAHSADAEGARNASDLGAARSEGSGEERSDAAQS